MILLAKYNTAMPTAALISPYHLTDTQILPPGTTFINYPLTHKPSTVRKIDI